MQFFRVCATTKLTILLTFLCVASCGFTQVIFNGASAPVKAELPPGTNTVTVSQTIPSQTNGLLVICVSMNNQQSPTSAISSITDNGSPVGIFPVGTVSTSPAKSRVEIWALKSPPAGLNTIRITIPVSAPTVGVVAASADFAQVNQTTPFEAFGSNTGSGNGSSPTVAVTSAAGEVVIDTVATAPAVTLTAGTGQNQEWQATSGASSTDTEGAGSIKAGSSPTATMTWTHAGAATWAIGAVSIRPSILTAVQLQSFTTYSGMDKNGAKRVILSWKTSGEAHNLGFNVYREQDGNRVRLNPSLIAGSALLMRGALPQHAAKHYAWIDPSEQAMGATYWLEDVDVNGTRALHGPVTAGAATSSYSGETIPKAALTFNQLNQSQPAAAFNEGSHPLENELHEFEPTLSQRQKQFELAAHPAVKIFVEHEGWHRVTQPELLKAGLDPDVDPAFLHLYAEAVEQPIKITGATAGPGGFGPKAALQFYGTGIDTQYSGTRVYWLVAGNEPGQRIHRRQPSSGSNQPPADFPFTVELTPHTTYFAALITPNGNNFFGSLVSSTPLDQKIYIPHLDKSSNELAKLEVTLQGIILGLPHAVTIALNGASLGDATYAGQEKGIFRVSVPLGVLHDGANTVTLTAQEGEFDTSLVQSIRITYPHSYTADSDSLKFTGRAGDELKITGFTSAPSVVLDITDPDQPLELTPQITSDNSNHYALGVQVPWSNTNPSAPARHTLLAVASDRVDSIAGIRPNHPSHWHRSQAGSKIVMVSYGEFAEALNPLVRAHEAEGNSAAVVLIDDLYDEFNFGERSPMAIRDFLRTATKAWRTAPHYLLLNGRASVDPRNYLGYGQLDLVPTKIVPTTSLMTASDDWFSDFNDTGMPTVATGRFPVSTPAEANVVAGKVATYEGQTTNGPWTSQALMVADVNDTENFTQDSQLVQTRLPSTMQVTDVFASTMTSAQVQQAIVTSVNSGQLLVNYTGHGSEDQWSGSNFFDSTTANALTNGSFLPVFLLMDCLNGLFQDVYEPPLAVTLMLAPNGGAVAVLSSSGLNQAPSQTILDELVVQNAFSASYPALGDAILEAKAGITDLGVRKTYNLLGDPAMQIKH
jgi:peptidase C25-like protein